MKTQIITLETHDDLISVRDRLSWAKTPRILLVWPKFEKVTLRQVDLKILHRHATTLGAQLGLVTRARQVRADAEALGIPVFESTGEAQRLAWPKMRRRKWRRKVPAKSLREKREQAYPEQTAGRIAEANAWRSHPVTRIAAFAVGVLSVLAIVAVFIPRAQVRLEPVTKMQIVELSVTANPSIDSVFITGTVPAREKRIVVDGVQTITVTGEGVVPQSKARGTVEFRNVTQQAITIPTGTVVSANDIRFVTSKDGEVDAGVGKVVSLPIVAVEGGIAGNVDSEAIKAIEGRLGLSLVVTNPEPTTGGRELSSVQASDQDRTRLKTLLMKNLETAAREKFLAEFNSGDLLFENTMENTQILAEKYDPPPGGVGTKLTLSMQVEFTAWYASASDLTELATLAMNASLPSGFAPASEAVTVKPLTNAFLDSDGSLRWNIHAEREIIQSFDSVFVTQLVQGLGVNKAQSNLQEHLPSESEPMIQVSPSWWRWVPLLPSRIEVITQ
ncbi:MAG TPA: hypothetical protein VFR47_24050 [Anaerolineales bacterium]|nr:hypothetical protein [Anaerolineales bacterium]